MKKILPYPLFFFLIVYLSSWCKTGIIQEEDELYSLFLKRQVKLTLISTPRPREKGRMNLLLLNDGQDMEKFRVKLILGSLRGKNLINPLLVIGIHAGDRLKEYGVADFPDYMGRGGQAGNYASFINDELLPYAIKKAGLPKFKSVVMAGCSLGGLSAFDIAWSHADRINKVGVFSGSFWWRDKDDKATGYSDSLDRIMLQKTRSSKKNPHLKYWFYAGAKEEAGDRNKNGIIDVIDDTKDLIEVIKSKNICLPDEIKYTEDENGRHDYPSWSNQLPYFLIWAFGVKG